MSDLKDLLDEVFPDSAIFKVKEDEDFETLSFKSAECQYLIFKEKLGLFFWERGGKEFVQRLLKDKWTIEEIIDSAKTNFNICPTKCWYGLANNFVIQKQDFLDALDCLGEGKVKELLQGEL